MSPILRTLRLLPTVMAVLFLATSGALAAGPIYWDWPADRPFAQLDLDGAALDRDGNLTAGLVYRELGPVGPEVFWRIVPDGRGGWYTGSGHNGEIHHVDGGGASELVAQLEGTEVFSLLLLPDGGLLAGCGPEGGFYHVSDGGEVTQIGSVAGGYVWALAMEPGPGQTVWLAAGSPAALYRYRMKEDLLEEVLTLPAQNALDLVFDEQGLLLVAAQGPGLVYRIDPENPSTSDLLLETAQDEARQFISGPGGDQYLLALEPVENGRDGLGQMEGSEGGPSQALLAMLEESGNGNGPERAALYRLDPAGLSYEVWSGPADLMIAGWSEKRGWVAAGPLAPDSDRAVLYQLTPPAGQHPLAAWVGGDVLDLQIDDEDGVVVAQAHPGSVALLGGGSGEARRAVSQPLDAGRPVTWGRLSWSGAEGSSKPVWSVRGGNRSVPDESWTAWSGTWTGVDHRLDLEPCRFLQWRVEFPDGEPGATTVTAVSVSAWRDNLPPVLSEFTLEQLSVMSFGTMGGRTESVTQTFRSGLQAEFSRGASADDRAGPDRSTMARSVRVFTWNGRDPDGDQLTYDLEYRTVGTTAWSPILLETPEGVGSWDTAGLPDGRYQVRLTARDDRDNPHHLAESTSRVLEEVRVDNTPPEVEQASFTGEADGFRIRLEAADTMGPLAGAVVVLPDGSRERLDPEDGICDSRGETFDAVVTWPRPGTRTVARPWRVGVEIWDLGGNVGRIEGEVE